MIRIVEHLSERQVLIHDGSNYFVVSENIAGSQKICGYSEVLVFRSSKNGDISDYSEVSGERHVELHEFLPKLIRHNKVEFF
jgi:hypothetical protein